MIYSLPSFHLTKALRSLRNILADQKCTALDHIWLLALVARAKSMVVKDRGTDITKLKTEGLAPCDWFACSQHTSETVSVARLRRHCENVITQRTT